MLGIHEYLEDKSKFYSCIKFPENNNKLIIIIIEAGNKKSTIA